MSQTGSGGRSHTEPVSSPEAGASVRAAVPTFSTRMQVIPRILPTPGQGGVRGFEMMGTAYCVEFPRDRYRNISIRFMRGSWNRGCPGSRPTDHRIGSPEGVIPTERSDRSSKECPEHRSESLAGIEKDVPPCSAVPADRLKRASRCPRHDVSPRKEPLCSEYRNRVAPAPGAPERSQGGSVTTDSPKPWGSCAIRSTGTASID
jgi:hypothetical protein